MKLAFLRGLCALCVEHSCMTRSSAKPRRVRIEADLKWPIAVNHLALNGAKPFVTLSPIVFVWREHRLVIAAGYQFDGASIPRALWWARGFSPLDRSIVAALAHDWICDHPRLLPRIVGDAIFYALLVDSGVPRWRAALMYLGVRLWSLAKNYLKRRGRGVRREK